jgi:uncharacterized circularly permuted ATP-grasp superfamily protein/uncharacterized alpha-E superfamily protein
METGVSQAPEKVGAGDAASWLHSSYHRRGVAIAADGSLPFDEAVEPSGQVRRHMERLFEGLEALGPSGIRDRWKKAERLLHENGVTYNVYGDPQGLDRPWPLDPIPQVFGAEEWKFIESAICQRATLLNTILADVYGPQRLVSTGAIPASLVLGNPHFLPACHGIKVPGDCYLHFYAADLARSPNGQWWVLADRTQSSSGGGYALENRSVLSRVMPETVHNCRIRPLHGFFEQYADSLRALAPRNRDNPRIVLLTPGPFNETYFEHAYLARYMGLTLVEGSDLIVRGDSVFLKTLNGLLPVDVILRRQDDIFCDPVELRSDSVLGVPGLVHAVRSGTVAVANTLGSGITDTAAMCAFLPGLCRMMLGEELRMPSVATWWCGQDLPFHSVREKLGQLVIKPAFPSFKAPPIFGSRLNSVERSALLEKIRRDPDLYVAQEMVDLSTMPVWTDTGLYSRRVVVRVYAIATADGNYHVMPGGLTRVAVSPDSFVVSMQEGGGSKDTWVLGESSMHAQNTRPVTAISTFSRASFDLPSRVADNLFWLARYAERLESGARLLRSLIRRLLEDRASEDSPEIKVLRNVLWGLGHIPGEAPADSVATEAAQPGRKITPQTLESQILSVIYDPALPASLASTVNSIRSIAWLLRERISADTWRVLFGLHLAFQRNQGVGPVPLVDALDLMSETIVLLSAFSGLALESMTRGMGWRILNMGQRIERGLQVTQLLEYGTRFAPEYESECVEILLEIAESSITYHSRYLSSLQTDLMLDLLLADETNPRGLAYQLERLVEQAAQLPATGADPTALQRMPERTRDRIRRTGMTQLLERDSDGDLGNLQTFLAEISADMTEFASVLTRTYLTHSLPTTNA